MRIKQKGYQEFGESSIIAVISIIFLRGSLDPNSCSGLEANDFLPISLHYVLLDEKGKGMERRPTTAKGRREEPTAHESRGREESQVEPWGWGFTGRGLAWVRSEESGSWGSE